MRHAAIARVCHEVNRAYCSALGDESQPPWETAPEWQQSSAINGVRLTVEDPARTPESSHIGWMEEKVADGWRYGPVKDPEAKTHPCLLPYQELPLEQRVKDHLFLAVVRALECSGG